MGIPPRWRGWRSKIVQQGASGVTPSRASKVRAVLRRIGWGASALVVLAMLAVAFYLWRATPQVDGTESLPGLSGPVRIERDAHGVPTVHAQTARDAFFGLGVVHAQDRLWQLETHRRIGSGRLA